MLNGGLLAMKAAHKFIKTGNKLLSCLFYAA